MVLHQLSNCLKMHFKTIKTNQEFFDFPDGLLISSFSAPLLVH